MINFEYRLAQNHMIKKMNWKSCAIERAKTHIKFYSPQSQKCKNEICTKLVKIL